MSNTQVVSDLSPAGLPVSCLPSPLLLLITRLIREMSRARYIIMSSRKYARRRRSTLRKGELINRPSRRCERFVLSSLSFCQPCAKFHL